MFHNVYEFCLKKYFPLKFDKIKSYLDLSIMMTKLCYNESMQTLDKYLNPLISFMVLSKSCLYNVK